MSTGMPNVPSDRLRSTRGDLYGDDCHLLLPIQGNARLHHSVTDTRQQHWRKRLWIVLSECFEQIGHDSVALGVGRGAFCITGRSERLVNACQTFAISRQCDLRECCGLARGRSCGLGVPLPPSASRANEMTSQQHQRDNNEGQRGDGPPRPVRQQPDVWVEANNSPQGCAMQRLVGYQSKPEGSG